MLSHLRVSNWVQNTPGPDMALIWPWHGTDLAELNQNETWSGLESLHKKWVSEWVIFSMCVSSDFSAVSGGTKRREGSSHTGHGRKRSHYQSPAKQVGQHGVWIWEDPACRWFTVRAALHLPLQMYDNPSKLLVLLLFQWHIKPSNYACKTLHISPFTTYTPQILCIGM